MTAVCDPTRDDPRLGAVASWFETLQARIVAAMEALEDAFGGAPEAGEPGRFTIDPWARTDASGAPGGGGRMAILRGTAVREDGRASLDGLWRLPGRIRRRKFRARPMTRASGRRASRSSPIRGAPMSRRRT